MGGNFIKEHSVVGDNESKMWENSIFDIFDFNNEQWLVFKCCSNCWYTLIVYAIISLDILNIQFK